MRTDLVGGRWGRDGLTLGFLGSSENFVLGSLRAGEGHLGKTLWLEQRLCYGVESIGREPWRVSEHQLYGHCPEEGGFAHTTWVGTQEPFLCMGVIWGAFLWSALVILLYPVPITVTHRRTCL